MILYFKGGSRWKNHLCIILHIRQNLNFLFHHSVFTFLRTVLLSFFESLEVRWASVLQRGTHFPSLHKTKTKAWSSVLGKKIQIMVLYIYILYILQIAFLPPGYLCPPPWTIGYKCWPRLENITGQNLVKTHLCEPSGYAPSHNGCWLTLVLSHNEDLCKK